MSKKDRGQFSGITVRDARLACTVVRRRKNELEVEEHTSVELPASWAELAAHEGGAEALKEALDSAKGQRVFALATEHALLRVVDLPTADTSEIPGMVDLQIEKVSPFPVDQLVVSHEVLGARGAQSRVLMAAVQRSRILQATAPFDAAGRYPQRLDLDVMGWWELMGARGDIPEKGRQALLLLDRNSTELIVTQDGLPVMFRALGGHGHSEGEIWNEEIAEETAYTLAALESEWGLMSVNRIVCWHWEDPPTSLLKRLTDETGLEAVAAAFEDLPPLCEGMARRAAREGYETLNLALSEWALGRRSRQTRRNAALVLGSILTVWIVVILALFIGVKRDRVHQVALEVSADRKETEAKAVRKLKDRIDSLETRLDRSHSALECLREVAVLLPESVEISSFLYKKGGDLSIRGQAPTTTPVHNFVEGMEKSPLFEEVKTEDIRSKLERNRRLTSYRLTARLPTGETDE